MEIFTKVNGSSTKRTESVRLPGPTEENTKDNGKKIEGTGEESILGPTETLMTEITKWVSNKVMEHSFNEMVANTRATTKTT